jgi:transposase
MIDGSITRVHKHAAGAKKSITDQGLGRSCGGFSSKVHAKVDSFGMPLKFIVTAGQEHDMKQAETLAGDDECEMLLADRGYDSDDFRKVLQDKGIQPVIPGKKNRKTKIEYDEHTYKERNAVERFFARMKEFRRLATRFRCPDLKDFAMIPICKLSLNLCLEILCMFRLVHGTNSVSRRLTIY